MGNVGSGRTELGQVFMTFTAIALLLTYMPLGAQETRNRERVNGLMGFVRTLGVPARGKEAGRTGVARVISPSVVFERRGTLTGLPQLQQNNDEKRKTPTSGEGGSYKGSTGEGHCRVTVLGPNGFGKDVKLITFTHSPGHEDPASGTVSLCVQLTKGAKQVEIPVSEMVKELRLFGKEAEVSQQDWEAPNFHMVLIRLNRIAEIARNYAAKKGYEKPSSVRVTGKTRSCCSHDGKGECDISEQYTEPANARDGVGSGRPGIVSGSKGHGK